MTNIIVDPRFRDKIPKPTPEERRRLEENILADGYVREPLVLWQGHSTLVDGHNRWEIIQAHPELSYRTVEQPFENEWDVIAWICRNQLGRRNISKVVYDKLLQEEHDAVQKSYGASDGFRGNQYKAVGGENLHLPDKAKKTRAIIAEEHGIPEGAVKSAVEFGRGLDAAEEVSPGIKEAVLSGAEKFAKKDIAALRNIPDPEQRKEAVAEMRNPSRVTFPSDKDPLKGAPTKEEKAIAKADRRVTDKSAKVEYSIEDLIEDLTSIQDDFFDKILLALDIHRDVALDHGKDRKRVLEFIRDFETRWKNDVKEIFR